jgi:UDP-N-acetylmuramoyl-L-alanyl-D-glutamate--2,6-diaminopimelate ligase
MTAAPDAPWSRPRWRLRALLREALGVARDDVPDVAVRGVAQSHELVVPGAIFVARVGATVDGHGFAEQAIAAGAVCVVGVRQGMTALPWRSVPYVRVDDDRWATSALAATFYGHPSRALRTLGVTGTDGKTTTATLLFELLQGPARTPQAALVSSAAARIGRRRVRFPGHFTTPEAPQVHGLLASAAAAGARYAVVESSSHGFALQRLEHVHYDIGAWTSFSPEHLDFHGTLEAYREAKRTLLRRAGVAVLNRDDPAWESFAEVASRVVTVGEHAGADVRADEIRERPSGLRFTLLADGERHACGLPLPGRFNLGNALVALAAARPASTLDWEQLTARLARFRGVPGRMQVVARRPATVIVDFAHTPPALANALAAVRPAPGGRRIVVIGAAGERDPGKRAPLGEAAMRGAELAVFTEEDHRSEDLSAILASMARGAEAAGGREGERFWRVPDRREAIAFAVGLAERGDVVLLCGKGHERTLERGDAALPWDEAAEARAAVRSLA